MTERERILKDCEEVLELDEKATDGPWTVVTSRDVFSAIIAEYVAMIGADFELNADAELTSRYRSLAPSLARYCRELLEEEEELRAQIRLWFKVPLADFDGATGEEMVRQGRSVTLVNWLKERQ